MKTKTSRKRPAFFLSLLAITGACLLQAACGDDDGAVKETIDSGQPSNPVDSSTPTDGSPPTDATLVDADCFLNPTTHFEIINACTDATRITKNPVLARLLPDGGLPPP